MNAGAKIVFCFSFGAACFLNAPDCAAQRAAESGETETNTKNVMQAAAPVLRDVYKKAEERIPVVKGVSELAAQAVPLAEKAVPIVKKGFVIGRKALRVLEKIFR